MSGHGPMPGSRCSVCRHPRAFEGDNALRNGKSAASVARFLGLARRDPVDRHIRSGHVAPVAPGVASGPAGGAKVAPSAGNANASPVEMLRAALDELRAMDASRMGAGAQTARLDAIRRSAESLGKLEPAPRQDTMSVADFMNTQLSDNGATFGQLLEAWVKVTEPYPEVREAMLTAMHTTLGTTPMKPRPGMETTA